MVGVPSESADNYRSSVCECVQLGDLDSVRAGTSAHVSGLTSYPSGEGSVVFAGADGFDDFGRHGLPFDAGLVENKAFVDAVMVAAEVRIEGNGDYQIDVTVGRLERTAW